MMEVVNQGLNQITGVRSTAPVLFPKLPLPLIDRATDVEESFKACARSGERGMALTDFQPTKKCKHLLTGAFKTTDSHQLRA